MGERRDDIRWRNTEEAETAMGEAWAAASKPDEQQLGWIQQTEAWLSVLPPTVNETELGVQAWRDSLFLGYGIDPPDLPSHCDGCGEAFTI